MSKEEYLGKKPSSMTLGPVTRPGDKPIGVTEEHTPGSWVRGLGVMIQGRGYARRVRAQPYDLLRYRVSQKPYTSKVLWPQLV